MRYGELNVVISPYFLFEIVNHRADSGLSNSIAKVTISINKATIFSIVISPGIRTVSSQQPQTAEYNKFVSNIIYLLVTPVT